MTPPGAPCGDTERSTGPQARRRPDEPALDLDGDLGIRPVVRSDAWADLGPDVATALLAARAAAGPGTSADAPEPADTAAGTRHLWIPDESGPVGGLRVVDLSSDTSDDASDDSSGPTVERVWVRSDVRQLGLAGALLSAVVARYGGRRLVADVTVEAAPLFARFGFVPGETVLHGGDPVVVLTRMVRAADTPWRD